MVNNAQRTPQASEVVKRDMNLDELMKFSADDMQNIVSSLSDESRISIWNELEKHIQDNTRESNDIAKMRYIRFHVQRVIRAMDESRREKTAVAQSLPVARTPDGERAWKILNGKTEETQKRTHIKTRSPDLQPRPQTVSADNGR